MYVTGDPGAPSPDAQEGTLKIRFGLGWAKSHAFFTGQCPVMKYNRGLMMSILYDKVHIADAVNATVFPLEEAPRAYEDFDEGAAIMPVFAPQAPIPDGYRKERAVSTGIANAGTDTANTGTQTGTEGENMEHRESTGELILNEGTPAVSLIGGGAVLGSMIGAAVPAISPVEGGVGGVVVGASLAIAHIAAHISRLRKNNPDS